MSDVDGMDLSAHTAFYYDDGQGHAVKVRRWLPWGHPDRVEVIA